MKNLNTIAPISNTKKLEVNPIGEIICKFKKYSPGYHIASGLFFIEFRAINSGNTIAFDKLYYNEEEENYFLDEVENVQFTQQQLEDGEVLINIDNDYNTVYTTKLKNVSENEAELILKDSSCTQQIREYIYGLYELLSPTIDGINFDELEFLNQTRGGLTLPHF